MKKITSIIGLITFMFQFNITYAQENVDYDKAMISLANDVVKKVKDRNKLKVAVWYFHSTFGKRTSLGDYVGRDFSIHFTNASSGLSIIDRDHLEQMLKEHELNSEGYINPVTAKKLGMLIGADVIVTGTVDVGLHHLRIRIKIINSETGLQIAAALKNIPIDESIRYILDGTGINKSKNIDRNKKPINKSEKYNNPESTDTNCERLKVGDYCFSNTTNNTYEIRIFGQQRGHFYGYMETITVGSHHDGCFLNLPSGKYSYIMVKNREYLREIRGNFNVKKCKSLTYSIK